MHSFKPIILKNNSTWSANWTFRINIVRPIMWSISGVISIAIIVTKSVNLHARDSFEQGLSNECWDLFNTAISILYIEIDAK